MYSIVVAMAKLWLAPLLVGCMCVDTKDIVRMQKGKYRIQLVKLS